MVNIAAYYYPGWHNHDGLEEWNLVRNAKPYFKGHNQPRVPSLGYLDDSEKSTLKIQTALASSYGIDAFIFDWYWKKGKRELGSPLEAFLSTDTNMKFAFLWTWKIAKRDLPATPGVVSEAEKSRWVETDTEDFLKLLTFCGDNYFKRKNYLHVEGKPYFVMYYVQGFVDKLGQDKLAEMIHEGKKLMKRRGFNGLYTIGVVTEPFDTDHFGFDALTGYNFLPDFSPNSPLIQDYGVLSKKRISDWKEIERVGNLPYIPSISAGWDASPRGIRVDNLSRNLGFPWAPIVVGNTPSKFGKFLRAGIEYAKSNKTDMVHLCAWNEWSEGAYLEPDKRYGLRFLEEVKKAKKRD